MNSAHTESMNELSEKLSGNVSIPKWTMWIFLFVYLCLSVVVKITSMSQKMIVISGSVTQVSSITGIFASIQSAIVIFMTIFYKKKGFIISLVLVFLGFISLLITVIRFHVFSGLSGFFSSLVTLVTVTFLFIYNNRIEKYQKDISAQAVTDLLTGLPNRRAGVNLVNALAGKKEDFAVAIIDIRNFKNINDTLGHTAGNRVLVDIALRMRTIAESRATGTQDFVSRYGGDEFAVIIKGYHGKNELFNTVKTYCDAVSERIELGDFEYYASGRCGYAEFPNDSDNPELLFAHADSALFASKHSADSQILKYTPEMSVSSEQTLEMERKIRKALEDDRIFFNLQPQYDIDHNLCGFEALARMKDADGSIVSPGAFIPVAEKVGIIDQVDGRVFRRSAEFFGAVIRETGCRNVTLSVNVSGLHLLKKNFIGEVRDIVTEYNIPADQLEIEITESVMVDSEKALNRINEIKALGIKIAIDDFGTGYSSLSYLNSFPADVLKVDKSFIDSMNTSDSAKQYVSAIISIGHIMNFAVISEGVEQNDQLATLKAIGCDMIQGFIWGRPLSPDDAEKLVRQSVSA